MTPNAPDAPTTRQTPCSAALTPGIAPVAYQHQPTLTEVKARIVMYISLLTSDEHLQVQPNSRSVFFFCFFLVGGISGFVEQAAIQACEGWSTRLSSRKYKLPDQNLPWHLARCCDTREHATATNRACRLSPFNIAIFTGVPQLE